MDYHKRERLVLDTSDVGGFLRLLDARLLRHTDAADVRSGILTEPLTAFADAWQAINEDCPDADTINADPTTAYKNTRKACSPSTVSQEIKDGREEMLTTFAKFVKGQRLIYVTVADALKSQLDT